tara:strand:+ start:3166 stop:4002 length:837 start_codon:yes stop_codon:yes gene_type:complete
MLASPIKTIAKKPAASRVPPMIELCHDALAEGVLEQHGGLPPSWLALFKAHPEAWQQLTDAVVASEGGKGPLGPHSTISITVIYEAPWTGSLDPPFGRLRSGDFPFGRLRSGDFYTMLVPLTALPRWFAILLNAYIESAMATPGANLQVDGNGGYHIKLGEMSSAATMWADLNDAWRVDRILKTTRLELFDAFQLNVRDELEPEITNQAQEGTPITDDDDIEILEMFDETAADIVHENIVDNASDMDEDWFKKLKSRHGVSFQRMLCKAPHVSLMIEL